MTLLEVSSPRKSSLAGQSTSWNRSFRCCRWHLCSECPLPSTMFVLPTSDFQVARWQDLQVQLLHLLLKSCFLGFLWGFDGDFHCENEQKDNPSRFCAGSFSSHDSEEDARNHHLCHSCMLHSYSRNTEVSRSFHLDSSLVFWSQHQKCPKLFLLRARLLDSCPSPSSCLRHCVRPSILIPSNMVLLQSTICNLGLSPHLFLRNA